MSVYAGCGHNYYGNTCAKCATAAGAEQECAKIVAWLRDNPDHLARKGWLADAIEAKEHLK